MEKVPRGGILAGIFLAGRDESGDRRGLGSDSETAPAERQCFGYPAPSRGANVELDAFWRQADTKSSVDQILGAALREDAALSEAPPGRDEATFALFPLGAAPNRVRATVTAKGSGVVCGLPGLLRTFELLGGSPEVEEQVADGSRVAPGDRVIVLLDSVQRVLRAERTALNWLGHLSGVASRSDHWASIAPDVELLDTRKTLPGWRRLEKHAVRAGGGTNHRMDLAEFPMIKENHRDLFRRSLPTPPENAGEEIRWILERLRAGYSGPVEIEVEDYESFLACLRHQVDWILIDNQIPETVADWIQRAETELGESADRWRHRLEASGGIDEARLAEYAGTGVRRISLGALTHSGPALDLSLHVEWCEE